MATHHFTGTALVYPAPDLSDQWVGVCPEFGVITQGDNIRDALESIWEALEIVIVDDLERGFDPHRRIAYSLAEDWDLMYRVLSEGAPVASVEGFPGEETRSVVVATSIHMAFDGFKPLRKVQTPAVASVAPRTPDAPRA